MTNRSALFGLTTGLAALACTPPFEDRPWLVEDARILAIATTPAEARPGRSVELTALVADPDGPAEPPIDWSVCPLPRRARERTAVAAECARGSGLTPTSSPSPIPADACARFGPNPPPTLDDQAPRRPADPDPSGGYFLPFGASAAFDDRRVFGFVRLRCDLAGVTRAVFDDYEARYSANISPGIEYAGLDGAEDDAPPRIDPGARVELELRASPDASEPYVLPDIGGARLLDRHEALTARWYVTDGELERGVQSRPGAPSEGQSPRFTVSWRAPATATLVRGWAVLADDRGGITWMPFQLDVR